LALALATAGCASKMIQEARVTEPVRLEVATAAEAPVRISIEGLIGPNSPGSWTRDAQWEEYVVRIANAGPEPVAVDRIELESLLPQPAVHTPSLDALRTQTGVNLRWLGSAAGVAAAAGYTAFAASGALFLSGSFTAAGTAFAAIGPAAAAGAVVYAVANAQQESADNRAIQERLLARAVAVPRALAPGEAASGSAFFAASPGPKRLVVHFHHGETKGSAWVDVTTLAGIAIASCGSPEAAVATPFVAPSNPLFAAEDGAIAFRLDGAWFRNSRGSWAADAYWDEYRVQLKALDKPVTIKAVLIADSAGRRFPSQVPACLNPYPERSKGSEFGMMVIPLHIGHAILENERQERTRIALFGGWLDARRTNFPLVIAGGATTPVTLIYPQVSQPARIEVRYEVDGVDRGLSIEAQELLARIRADTPPVLIERRPPRQPPAVKAPGFVRARLTLDAVGRPRWVHILESSPDGLYDKVAMSAFSRWRYNRGEADRTVEARIDFPMEE
jgi:TonB family protein